MLDLVSPVISLLLVMVFVHPQPFVFLLILLPISSIAQNNGTITFGSTLTATDNSTSSWLSSSGDFALGFRPLEDEKDLFLLCIWFAKIPDKTIVWDASDKSKGDIYIPVPRGSKVELKTDQGLVLTDPQGQGAALWISNCVVGTVAKGVLIDTGNFLLQDNNIKKLWASFDNPTDTLLPTQTMKREGLLSSRQSETNFFKGRFQLWLRKNKANLVLNTINLPSDSSNVAYYDTSKTFHQKQGILDTPYSIQMTSMTAANQTSYKAMKKTS